MATQSPEIVAVSSTNHWMHQYPDVPSAIAHHQHAAPDTEFFDTDGRRLHPVIDAQGAVVRLETVGGPDPGLIDRRFSAVIGVRRRAAIRDLGQTHRLTDGRSLTSAETLSQLTIATGLSAEARRRVLLGGAGTGGRLALLRRVGRRLLGRKDRLGPVDHVPPVGPPTIIPNEGGWLHMLICHPFGVAGESGGPPAAPPP